MEPTFGLVIIAANEEKILPRCLNSVKHLADYTLIQVGSLSDPTVEVARKILGDKGEVIEYPWVDFDVNKTHLFLQARVRVKTDFLFFLDAKEVFVQPNFAPLTLEVRKKLVEEINQYPTTNVFRLMTVRGNNTWNRWQIVRNNQTYSWKYPVHEQLRSEKGDGPFVILKTIINYARYDGSSGTGEEKYKRYAQRLVAGLSRYPSSDTEAIRHCTFYAAQSFCDHSNYDDGLKWYLKYIELKANDEYHYIALCRAAWIYQHKKKYADAERLFKLAIQFKPFVSKAYYELSSMYYSMNRFQDAVNLLNTIISSSKQPVMFEDTTINEWRLERDLAVNLWRLGNSSQAYLILKKLIAKSNIIYENDLKKDLEIVSASAPSPPPAPISMDSLTQSDIVSDSRLWEVKNGNIPNIVIIDNFLDNPDEVRRFALSQEFHVKGNYPGGRTDCFRSDFHKEQFERILGGKITYWPDGYNGSFQIVTGGAKTWWHRDKTVYSAILYLTPDAPVDSGTSIYKHRKLGISKESNQPQENIDQLNNDSNNPDAWELVDKVGYVYNRLVIFSGFYTHRADKYFGHDNETGRLTQVFFFNI